MHTTPALPAPRLPIADAVLDAVASRDLERLGAQLEPDVVVHALLPDGLREWRGAARVVEAFRGWYGAVDSCELLEVDTGLHGPRLRLRWRARVRGGPFGDTPFVVEQHVYAEPGPTSRIVTMSMLCSGFVEERRHG